MDREQLGPFLSEEVIRMPAWLRFDAGHLGPPIVAVGVVLAAFVYWKVNDRAPPFRYLTGTGAAFISCPPNDTHGCIEVNGNPPVVIAKEGGEVVRNRQVDFFRAGCHIQITGHVASPLGDVQDVDQFEVGMSRQAEWVANTAVKKPNQFNKRMPVIVPADKNGVKHYGNICYFSVDYATCNWVQRIWPFKLDQIRIDGPMMCYQVEKPAAAN
jgi:hypothetical protein